MVTSTPYPIRHSESPYHSTLNCRSSCESVVK